MSAPEGGQVNLNCPAQDKKFQANRAQDLWIQKSLSSDRVAPVKQLEELVERRIGCSGGIVKDQPSLSFVSYRRTVDGDLLLKLQTGEYYVPTLEDGSSKFLQSVNVLPKLSKLPDTSTSLSSKEGFDVFMKLLAGTEEDTAKTSPSSQEASGSSQGLQQANIVPGHNEEGTLPELHVAVCERPNKDTPKTSPSSQEASESSLRLQQASMVSEHNEEGTLPELHVAECERPNKDTPKTSPSSQEASESSQGLQQASMVLEHNEEGILLLYLYMAVYVKPNKDTSSLSSQEASESSQGLQQASTVPGHNEKGILPLYVAVYVKPNKDQKYVLTDSDEGQGDHEKQIIQRYLEGQLFVYGYVEALMHLWIREGKKSIPSTFMLAGELYHSLVCARAPAKYNVVEELLRRKKQTGDYDRESRKTDLKGYPPSERMLTLLKSRIRAGLQKLKMHLDYCHTRGSTNYSCDVQYRAVNVKRCLGLLQLVHQILDKERSNKNIINIIDITLVETLVDKCNQLTETYFAQKPDSLAVNRRYKEAYAAVRESFGNIRRNVERWRDAVLHSVVPWFKEGAYNSNVRKLMNRGLARFGKGGNGELVEAFQSGERLVIKQTLLRESEWSIVTQMDHPNVMPWLALICGDRSDTKPGQIVSYQVMPKMTEDLSAAIRKMGGSIHHYILQLQEAEEPNSVLSEKADLVRQRSAEILRGTLQGLDYMHRQNLVHRDIKASNILLKRPVDCPHEAVHTCTCRERWEVRVADFDSVIHLPVARDRAQRRKQLKVGNTGTSGYRAPEVFFECCSSDTDAKDYYSPASDIWSFGAVCLHLAMGFCCPRHQYQVGLIMLARHNLVNIPAEEAQEKVDRTVGMYHIRQGFTGEKWQNMINFIARLLEVDWSKRPSAETLLKDPFVKPATTPHNSQTDDASSKESVQNTAAVSDASPPKKSCSASQEQSPANSNEEGVQEAKNPSTLPLTSNESVQGGCRCSDISEEQRQEGDGNHERSDNGQPVGQGSSTQTPGSSSSANIKSNTTSEDGRCGNGSPVGQDSSSQTRISDKNSRSHSSSGSEDNDNGCTSSVVVEEAGDKPSLLEPPQADQLYDRIDQALPAETYQVVASPTIQTPLIQSTSQTTQMSTLQTGQESASQTAQVSAPQIGQQSALQTGQELHSTEFKTVESDDIGVVRLQNGDRHSSAESSASSTCSRPACTYVSDQSTPPPELYQPMPLVIIMDDIPPQQNDCVEVPSVCHLSSHHSTSEGEQLAEQEEATNGGMPGGVLVAGSTLQVQCSTGLTELVVSSSSSSARYRNVVGLPTVCTVCKIKEHYKHDSDDEDSEKEKKKAMD